MFNKKRYLNAILSGFLILLIIPLAYAGSYGTGAYNSGDYGVGEVPVSTSTSGGSGGATEKSSKSVEVTYECTKDSDCKGNQYCSKHKCYDSKCSSDSDCNIKEGETCLDYKCIKLFDIKIIDFESQIKLGTEFEFSYFLKGMANISGDVEVHFWIEKDDKAVTSGHDTIYLGNKEEKTEKTKIYLPTTVDSGVYTFFIQLVYGNYKVNTHRTIEIVVDKEKETATILGKTEVAKRSPYSIYTLIGLVVFILLFISWFKRKKTNALELAIRESSFIAEHKKMLWMSSMIIIFTGVVAYLFYAGILKLEQLQSLWNNIAGWFSGSVMPFVKNIWRNILLYLSPANKYFYLVIASIIGLVIIITSVIIAKKKHLFGEIKSWQELERIGRNKEKSKKIRLRANKLENFKEFVEKHKILLIILGIIFICSMSIAILSYYRVLSAEQFSKFSSNVGGGISNLGKNIISIISNLWNNIQPVLFNAYTKSLNWIILKYIYLIAGILTITLSIFSYLKRENLKKISSKVWNFIVEHKLIFLILLGLIIISAIIIYLFYSGIVTFREIKYLIKRW